MLLRDTDPKNRNTNPASKWLNASSPKCPRFFHCVIADISWKFNENPFYRNAASRHTTAPGWDTAKQSSEAWISLTNYSLWRAWCFLKIIWKSVTRFSIILLTNTDPGNGKIDPRFNQPQHPKNARDCFSSHVQTLQKISWKSVQPFSRNVTDRHGFPWKHIKRNPIDRQTNIQTSKRENITFVIRRR